MHCTVEEDNATATLAAKVLEMGKLKRFEEVFVKKVSPSLHGAEAVDQFLLGAEALFPSHILAVQQRSNEIGVAFS